MQVSDVQGEGCIARVISQSSSTNAVTESYRRGHSSTLSLESKLAPIGCVEPP